MKSCCERDTDGDGNCDKHHAPDCKCPMCSQVGARPGPLLPPPPDHIMQFFEYAHLPVSLQAVSRPFGELARHIEMTVPRNPERTVALRKLLESKDAAVRAFIAK